MTDGVLMVGKRRITGETKDPSCRRANWLEERVSYCQMSQLATGKETQSGRGLLRYSHGVENEKPSAIGFHHELASSDPVEREIGLCTLALY